MKRLLYVLVIWMLSSSVSEAQSGMIDINGKQYLIDTLEQYSVGPGIDYVRFNIQMGSINHKLYLLRADLQNPYIKIEENPGQDRLGKTEGMVTTHNRIDSAGHHPVGSVNCNFWVVSSQNTGHNEGLLNQPFAGTAKDGVLITEPDDWNYAYNADGSIVHGDRGFLMIDEAGKALIRNLVWNGRLIKGSKSYAIRDCNRTRVNPNASEITLFNRYIGVPTRQIPDSAIEVIFEPIDGKQWSINDTMQCVVKSINTTGGTTLSGSMGVLQGRGKGKTRINNCIKAVGDTFSLYLGMYSKSLMSADAPGNDSITPHIMQMVTGNCLVMENGELNIRNTNEDYNNRNYPRTMLATDNEGSRLWMLVSENPGNYTAEMCAMLLHDGATWAAGMDGGGSAQMNLLGKIINTTTEGSPRAVSNSLFIINTAPDDNTATRLSSRTTFIRLPRYGVAKPVFNVYNLYGTLLMRDFADVTLSCAPETGYITDEGSFVCLGNGTLSATYQNARMDIPVIAESGSQPAIVPDSIWIDNRHQYTVEIQTKAGDTTYPILASALQWEVADPDICSTDSKGVITGLSNGATTVIGTLEGKNDSLAVTTEIANVNPLLLTDFSSDDEQWKPTTTSTVSTLGFTPSADGGLLTFKYKKSRVPVINFAQDIRLYSLPTKVRYVIDNKGFPISQMSINMQARGQSAQTYTITRLEEGEQTIDIDVAALLGNTVRIYPVRIKNLRIQFDASAEEKEYQLLLKRIELWYGDEASGVENIRQEGGRAKKILVDGHIYIINNNKTYNLTGNEIR